ncbi:MAG: hypothetical protein ACOC2Z_00620, partial [Coleofasciculus sp.]
GFQMTALGIPLNPYQGLKRTNQTGNCLIDTWNSPESLSGIETFPAPPSLAGKGVGGLGFPNKKISA